MSPDKLQRISVIVNEHSGSGNNNELIRQATDGMPNVRQHDFHTEFKPNKDNVRAQIYLESDVILSGSGDGTCGYIWTQSLNRQQEPRGEIAYGLLPNGGENVLAHFTTGRRRYDRNKVKNIRQIIQEISQGNYTTKQIEPAIITTDQNDKADIFWQFGAGDGQLMDILLGQVEAWRPRVQQKHLRKLLAGVTSAIHLNYSPQHPLHIKLGQTQLEAYEIAHVSKNFPQLAHWDMRGTDNSFLLYVADRYHKFPRIRGALAAMDATAISFQKQRRMPINPPFKTLLYREWNDALTVYAAERQTILIQDSEIKSANKGEIAPWKHVTFDPEACNKSLRILQMNQT